MPKVPIALCKLQGVNVKLLIANARGQGPIAKCKSQIWQVRLPSAKGKVQIARGQGPGISHKRGQHQSKTYPLHKNQGFDSKGFRVPIMKCHGSGANFHWPMPGGQGPEANCKLPIAIANGQEPRANCKRPKARDFTQDTQKSSKTIQNSEQNQGFR